MLSLLRNKIIVTFYFFAGAFLPLHSQSWQRVGKLGLDYHVNGLFSKIENGKLYLTGQFTSADSIQCPGICIWNGDNFENFLPQPPTKACPVCPTGQIIKYDNKYFLTGEYLMGSILESVGEDWKPSAKFPSGCLANGYDILNNKLILIGWFDSINDIPAKCIAEYNTKTHSWQRFANNEIIDSRYSNGEEYFTSMAYYKDEYYFAGNINRNDNFKEILRYDGTNWKPLDKGILGKGADVHGMVVYKDILYIWGNIFQSDGNSADYVLAWDGEKWFDPFPNIKYLYGLNNMSVINNNLYMTGMFVFPKDNDSLAFVLARFDGCNFSAFGLQMKYPELIDAPRGVVGFQGRIYATVWDSLQGKYAGYLISFDENVPNFRTVNISECPVNIDTAFSTMLFPSPFDDKLELTSSKCYDGAEISISDMLGRKVFQTSFNMKKENSFNLLHLSGGVYYVTVKAGGETVVKSKVLKR